MRNLYIRKGLPYTRDKISWLQFHRGILLRNELYVGIYGFTPKSGKCYIDSLYDITDRSAYGYQSRFRVYASYEDKIRSTLYRFSSDRDLYVPYGDIRDLVLCSELYAIPTFLNWKNGEDREVLFASLMEGGNFLENVQRRYAEYLRFN